MADSIRSRVARIRHLIRDPRSRGVIVLTSGGTVASALGLVLLPLITNLYQPQAYATFALVFTAAAVLSTIATGKFEQAIPLQPDDEAGSIRAQRLGALSAWTAGALCLVAQPIVLVLARWGDLESGTSQALIAAPLLVWLSGLVTVQTQLLTRYGRYRAMALFQLTRTILQLVAQIILGSVNPSVAALVTGFGISLIPQAAHCLWLVRGSLRTAPALLARLASEERHLPYYQAPTALVRALETNIALFVLAATYGDSLVALYALSLRVVVSPATLAASAANTVYFREAPRISIPSNRRLYRHMSLALAAVGLVSIAFLIILADPISSVLGNGWQQAGAAIRATAPLALAVFLGAIPSTTLLVMGRNRELLWSRIAITILPILAVTLAYIAAAPGLTALLFYSLTMLVCVLALTVAVARGLSVLERRETLPVQTPPTACGQPLGLSQNE